MHKHFRPVRNAPQHWCGGPRSHAISQLIPAPRTMAAIRHAGRTLSNRVMPLPGRERQPSPRTPIDGTVAQTVQWPHIRATGRHSRPALHQMCDPTEISGRSLRIRPARLFISFTGLKRTLRRRLRPSLRASSGNATSPSSNRQNLRPG